MIHTRTNKPVQIFSALLFLLAQIQLLIHHTEIEAHAGESECEICVHFGQLGNGLGSESVTVEIPSSAIEETLIADNTRVKVPLYGLPQPRAPPTSALI